MSEATKDPMIGIGIAAVERIYKLEDRLAEYDGRFCENHKATGSSGRLVGCLRCAAEEQAQALYELDCLVEPDKGAVREGANPYSMDDQPRGVVERVTAALTAALARAEAAEKQRDYFRSIAKVELVAYGKLLEACGNSEPSAGHDVVDEVTGLLRVTRSQRDTAEAALSAAERERGRQVAICKIAYREQEHLRTLLAQCGEDCSALRVEFDAALSRQRRVAGRLLDEGQAWPDGGAWARALAAELSEGG